MSSFQTTESLLIEANTLFVDDNFEEALVKYNKAVDLEPDNVDAYVKRSSCHYRLKNFAASVSDAMTALKLNPKSAEAFYRKGLASFEEEEFQVAKKDFEAALKLNTQNKKYNMWLRKCQAELDSKDSTVAPTKSTPVENTPVVKAEPVVQKTEPVVAPTPKGPSPLHSIPSPVSKPANLSDLPAPKNNIRYEWFQTEQFVTLEIFAKNVKAEDADIKIGTKSLDVTIKLGGGSDYVLDIPLADPIETSESSYTIGTSKIEVKLKKKAGMKWKTLYAADNAVSTWDSKVGSTSSTPVYPSSKGVKNWDAIKDEDDKLEGDAAMNKVFKDIYSGANDDQRRAMMKSYYESGGTVLSTNWSEVKTGPVKGSPPKGADPEKWGKKLE